MTPQELEIKSIIEETTCTKYIGKLKISEEPIGDSTLWTLFLYLNLELTPMIFAYDGTWEQFKDFVASEMKSRKLYNVHFWKAVQEYPTLDEYYE